MGLVCYRPSLIWAEMSFNNISLSGRFKRNQVGIGLEVMLPENVDDGRRALKNILSSRCALGPLN